MRLLKEKAHTKCARRADVVQPRLTSRIDVNEIHPVKAEDAEEGEEPKRIQLRAIVTGGLRGHSSAIVASGCAETTADK